MYFTLFLGCIFLFSKPVIWYIYMFFNIYIQSLYSSVKTTWKMKPCLTCIYLYFLILYCLFIYFIVFMFLTFFTRRLNVNLLSRMRSSSYVLSAAHSGSEANRLASGCNNGPNQHRVYLYLDPVQVVDTVPVLTRNLGSLQSTTSGSAVSIGG